MCLFSMLMTAKASKNYSEVRKRENYKGMGCNDGSSLMLLIISVVFLVIEISMLYFAVKVALASGKSSTTKFVNVILALTLTLPYLLLSVLFNEDARAALGDGAPALKFACNY